MRRTAEEDYPVLADVAAFASSAFCAEAKRAMAEINEHRFPLTAISPTIEVGQVWTGAIPGQVAATDETFRVHRLTPTCKVAVGMLDDDGTEYDGTAIAVADLLAAISLGWLRLVEPTAAVQPCTPVDPPKVYGNDDPGQVLDDHVPVAAPPVESAAVVDFGPKAKGGQKPLSDAHYRQVAIVALAAKRSGGSQIAAVMAGFAAPRARCNNWLTKCRSLGMLDDPADGAYVEPVAAEPVADVIVSGPSFEVAKPVLPQVRPNPIQRSPSVVKEHVPDLTLGEPAADADAELVRKRTSYEKVAAIYRDAVTANVRPIGRLCDVFDVHRVTANQWVAACRERGLLPPRDQPQVPGELPVGRAVVGARRSNSSQP